MERFALLFPGQGTQYIGMGKSLCEQYAVAKQVFTEANDILAFDIMKLCFEGNSFELNKVENALPAILIASVAAFKAYMTEIGIKPIISAGHSLGEYTALTCSGAISFADALKIVRLRSILASEISKDINGAMTVINDIDADSVEQACKKASDSDNIVSIACYNSPDQFVISGHQSAVMSVEDILINKNAQITPILMSPPFHCVIMKALMKRLRDELEKIKFNPFMWPVISNVSGARYRDSQEVIENLSLQVVKPVLWRSTLECIRAMGINTYIEISPQSVLKDLTSRNFMDAKVYSYIQLDDRNEISILFQARSSISKKTGRRYAITVITKCLAAAVSTKNNNWNNDEYEKGVVIPFKEIQELQMQLQKENLLPTVEQMYKALHMLKSVLDTKKVPKEKQTGIFNKILKETETYELLGDFKIM